MDNYATGMILPRREIALKAQSFLNFTALPPLPSGRFGHYDLVKSKWGMLRNDQLGDCVVAGAMHEEMINGAMGGQEIHFTDQMAESDYSALSGWHRWLPFSDRGVDIEQAAKYRRETGITSSIGKRKIDFYADLAFGSHQRNLMIGQACHLLGPVGLGVMLPDTAEAEFENAQPWEDVSRPPGGGHYVPLVGRNPRGMWLVVTWGRLQAVSDEWLIKYVAIALAYVSLNQLNAKGLTPDQYDRAKLEAFARAVA